MTLGVDSNTGLIQTAGSFNFSAANQNGSPVGELTGVSIDNSGFVIASFSNGQTQKLYQVPLASVNNPDGLESVSGNAYEQTLASGIANLEFAGTSGVGTLTPSSLEQSNVDLSTQLTDLIVAQQAYGANSKVLTVADTLLQELDQIIQS
jgi:flagellar hook protein FlgE